MLNDRITPLSGQNLLTFLRSLPSNEVSKIEVITIPPAKYEAEGNSGLINIVLKKNKLNSWNAGISATYIQSKYARNSVAGNFNYRKNKISLSLNLNYRYGPKEKEDSAFFYYPEKYWGNDRKYKIYNNGLGTNIEFDYSINKMWTMGVQYLGNFYKQPVTSDNLSYIKDIHSTSIDTIIKTPSNKSSKRQLNAFNYFNKFKIDSLGKTINVGLNYYNFSTDANSHFNTHYYLNNKGEIPGKYYSAINSGSEKSINYSGTIDFDLPYKWADLKFGGKFSHTKNNSSISLFNTTSGSPVLDSNQSNNFIYKENIQAIYISGDKKFSKHFEAKAGLRLENTQTKGISTTSNLRNENNYLKPFPTLYFLYSLNKSAFNLNFNRRIDRPAYWLLNPFREYASSISYIEGNPFLEPSYTTNYEFNYTYNNNLNIRLYYSRTTNGYEQVVIVNPESDIHVISPRNFIDIKNYGVEVTYTFQNLDWWNSYIDLNLYRSHATSGLKITNKNASEATIYFSTYNDFFFNQKKTLIGSINFLYSSPSIYALTKYTSYSELDIAFKALLLDKKLQIGVVGSDLYYGNISDQISYVNNIKQIGRIYFPTRHFKLTISYNFGNKNIKSSKNKFGNEEEQNRL